MENFSVRYIYFFLGILPFRINATKFRRTAATVVREKRSGLASDVADLMCHSKNTADNVYYVKKREKNAIKGAKGLSEIMRAPSSPKKILKNKTNQESLEKMQKSSPSRKQWTQREIDAVTDVFAGD